MGNFTSKLLFQRENQEPQGKVHDVVNLSTPLKYTLTPPMKRRTLPIDPRSATIGIPRTPIDVTPTPPKLSNRTINAIPKRLQPKPFLETNFDTTVPVLEIKNDLDIKCSEIPQFKSSTVVCSPNDTGIPKVKHNSNNEIINVQNKILNLDPRSPATDFDRTPILKSKSRAHSYENLKTATYSNMKAPARLSFCETTTSFNIPEIQALPDIIQDSVCITDESISPDSSYTSIDNDVANKSISENENKIDEPITELLLQISKNQKGSSKVVPSIVHAVVDDYEILQSNTEKVIDNILITAMKKVELEYKTGISNKQIQIWNDPEDCDAENENEKENCQKIELKKDVIIDFDDVPLTNNTKEALTGKLMEDMKKQNCLETKKYDNTHSVKDLPAAFMLKCRTPLGNRSNNYNSVHNKTTQSPQQLFRGKGNSAKSQQENTPPTNKRYPPINKFNGTLWDSDSTIVI